MQNVGRDGAAGGGSGGGSGLSFEMECGEPQVECELVAWNWAKKSSAAVMNCRAGGCVSAPVRRPVRRSKRGRVVWDGRAGGYLLQIQLSSSDAKHAKPSLGKGPSTFKYSVVYAGAAWQWR